MDSGSPQESSDEDTQLLEEQRYHGSGWALCLLSPPLPVLRWLFQVSHRGTNVPISAQCHLSHPSFALVADEHMARQDQRLPDALGDVDEKRW